MRPIALNAKIEVLVNYWNKLQGTLMDRAQQSNVKRLKMLILEIVKVPAEIKHEVLRFIVKKCMELHSIAFLQWRYLFPGNSPYYSDDVLDELIQARIEFFYINYSDCRCKLHKKSNLPKGFQNHYGDLLSPSEEFQISSFDQIGILNPFEIQTEENPFKPKKPDDLVYHKDRFKKG